MNHTHYRVMDVPSQDTVTLTKTSTMRDLYQLLETRDLPEHISVLSNDRSSAYIDREEAEEFFTSYMLFIDNDMKSTFLARLEQLSVSAFVRERSTLSHAKKNEPDVSEIPVASSF